MSEAESTIKDYRIYLLKFMDEKDQSLSLLSIKKDSRLRAHFEKLKTAMLELEERKLVVKTSQVHQNYNLTTEGKIAAKYDSLQDFENAHSPEIARLHHLSEQTRFLFALAEAAERQAKAAELQLKSAKLQAIAMRNQSSAAQTAATAASRQAQAARDHVKAAISQTESAARVEKMQKWTMIATIATMVFIGVQALFLYLDFKHTHLNQEPTHPINLTLDYKDLPAPAAVLPTDSNPQTESSKIQTAR